MLAQWGGSDGTEAAETSRRPFGIREWEGGIPGWAEPRHGAYGPNGVGWEPAALFVGEDVRVEARPGKVRPVWGSREGVVRL